MKWRSILLLSCLLTTSASWAQKAFIYNSLQKNGFFSISLGTSLPTGNFGKVANCTETSGSGLAVSGRALSISGGYRLGGPLGIMARYETVQHTIQPAALAQQYPQLAGEPVKVIASAGAKGQWQSRSVMLGPYVTVPLGRVAIDFRALAGQAWATCPETCVQGTVNSVEASFRSGNQESTAIGSSLGMTLRYRLSPVVGLHMNTDYSTATFRFNNIPLEEKVGGLTSVTTYSANRTLSMVNFSAGLTIQFRSKNRIF